MNHTQILIHSLTSIALPRQQVPSVAIETVYISDNTSIIPDEVLSHRLGLLPLRCDPSKLDFVQGEDETDSDTGSEYLHTFDNISIELCLYLLLFVPISRIPIGCAVSTKLCGDRQD